jgi:hypothetical protein
MERVALAMDAEWTPEVEAHASGCAECRELLADRDRLGTLQPIPDAALAAVRARVLDRVAPSHRWWWAVAASLIILLGGVTWRAASLPDAEPLRAAVPAPAAPVIQPVGRARPAPLPQRQLRPAPQPAALARALREVLEPETAPPVAADGPVVVAMQTEDPTVVIVLVGEPKGDEE